MNKAQQDRFDALVEDAIASLPPGYRRHLDELPVVVLDEPTDQMLKDLGVERTDQGAKDEICGLEGCGQCCLLSSRVPAWSSFLTLGLLRLSYLAF